jgi:hypothetical protein
MTAPTTTARNQTVLDTVLNSLRRASRYNRSDQEAPAVVLWTDKDRQWEPLLPRLRASLPQLLTLGPYDPATLTGPAIWIKCMIARTLPEASWDESLTPILYLPDVSRQELRAVENCAKHLQPLAELQYRGAYWTQSNAKDWTVLAFLQSSDGGLGLEVARDAATLESMRRALTQLAETKVEELRGKRLESSDFDAMRVPDPVRDLLAWMDDPTPARQRWDGGTWETFRSICRQQFGFDPEKDGEIVGAERLASGQGAWKGVWARFAEAPRRYPKLPDLLRRARPKTTGEDLFVKQASAVWPQDNEAMEAELRSSLRSLKDAAPAEAARKIVGLEGQHSERRGWVWAELGQARLAQALQPLDILASAAARPLTGGTPDEMARAYAEGGWRTDEAVLDALASVKSAKDVEAVCAAVNSVYRPWLEQAAIRFQQLVTAQPLPSAATSPAPHATGSGTAILFADGLRFDVGQKLKHALASRGLLVSERWHWVAQPSVTATAKPAVSPVADLLSAELDAEEFRPVVAATGKALTTDRFRQLMGECGYQILASNETGDASAMAWTEIGDLDSYGHGHGWKLAWRVAEVLDETVERIVALLAAGWKTVRVVTDHGWLLLPGGLPKAELSGFLADSRWGRCAALKQTSVVNTTVVIWHWSPHVRIAVPPGIGAFKAGLEYAHGGVSLQECVAVELTITGGGAGRPQASVASAEWFGLRCRVYVAGTSEGLRVDVRARAGDPATSIAAVKDVAGAGPTTLFVEDDSQEGAAAVVVLLGPDGSVISKLPTTVGG